MFLCKNYIRSKKAHHFSCEYWIYNFWPTYYLKLLVTLEQLWFLVTLNQIILNNFVKGSLTVQLTSCLFCLDCFAYVQWTNGQIQTSQTRGQLYSNTPPMVSVLCLYHVMALCLRRRRRRGWDVVRAEPTRPDEVRHARGRAVGVLHALQGGAVRVGARGVDGMVEKRGRALGRFF